MGNTYKYLQTFVLCFCIVQISCDAPQNIGDKVKHEDAPQNVGNKVKQEDAPQNIGNKVKQNAELSDKTSSKPAPPPSSTPPPEPPVTVTVVPTSSEKPTTETPTTPPTPSERTPGKWNVTEANKTCIILNSCIDIIVPYEKTDNTTGVVTLQIPESANATGKCKTDKGTETIQLTFPLESNVTGIISFEFAKNETEILLSGVEVNIPADNITFKDINPDKRIEFHVKNLNAFETPLNMSYLCVKENELNLTKVGNETGKVIFKQLHLQAFKVTDGTEFDAVKDCEPFITPDIVPIIVGCTLALLVIVVLVAYLIARRKQPARGYLSM